MALSIGVDVGGTKIAAGVVNEDGAVLATVRRSSPAASREAIFETIAAVAGELAAQYDAPTIGVGAAGFTSSDRNTMVYGTNIDWTGARIADDREDGFSSNCAAARRKLPSRAMAAKAASSPNSEERITAPQSGKTRLYRFSKQSMRHKAAYPAQSRRLSCALPQHTENP